MFTGDANFVILSALASSAIGTLNTSMSLFLKSGSDSKDVIAHLEVCGFDKNDQMSIKAQFNLRGNVTRLLAQWLKIPKALLEMPYATQVRQGCILTIVLDSDNESLVFFSFVSPFFHFFRLA